MKKIFLVLFVILCISISSGNFNTYRESVGVLLNKNKDSDYTVLFVGLDDANKNTDVIFLLNYSFENNKGRVIQIPRDTFVCENGESFKINSYFSKYIDEGLNESDALKKLSDKLSDMFSLRIDGSVGLTTEGFVSLVDSVGGVDISLKSDYEIKGRDNSVLLKLSAGLNHLSGRESQIFVRHRSSYKNQDLGRMDAMKIFIESFFSSIKKAKPREIPRLIKENSKNLITNVNISDLFSIITKKSGRISDIKLDYVTLAGEAVEYLGVSYYVLNRKSVIELFDFLGIEQTEEFDTMRIFTTENDSDINKIYNSNNINYRVFTGEDLKEMPH